MFLKAKIRFIEIFWRIPDGSFSSRPTINASPMNMSRCEAFVAPRHLRRMYPERETSWRILTKEMVMALFPGSEGFHAIFTSKVQFTEGKDILILRPLSRCNQKYRNQFATMFHLWINGFLVNLANFYILAVQHFNNIA